MRARLAALLLAIPFAAGAQRRDPLAGFDAYAEQARKDWRVPGMAVVVVKDDAVVFAKGFGVRELGKPDPVGVHTRFGNMSTTKAFTALLVAMLADSGRIRLDEPVATYVPTLRLADPYVTRELTVRDALTHRVGFGDPGYLWDGTPYDFDEIVRRLRFVPVESSFRSRFAYNNVAYGLAGAAAARAAGTTWQALLRRRILEPLGMTETYADGEEASEAGVEMTAPHGVVRDTVRVLPASASVVDPVAPAGSMFSTATDMAKWLRFLLDSGRVDGRRLVSAERFADLFTAQQVVPPDEFYPTMRLTKPHVTAYGMGWFLEDYRGEWVAFHTGSIEGRSAIVGLIPDRRLGVAVFTNLDHSELRHALMYAAFDRYLGAAARPRDWSAEMRAMYRALADTAATRARARDAQRVTGTRPSLPADRYVGTYTDSLFGTATVGRDGDRLTFRAGAYAGTLDHWQYDVFRVTWADPFLGTSRVAFTLDPDGAVGTLQFVGEPNRYRKVR
jgi:CubicO group peptidase (beta-lactamase class C family)